MNRVHAPSTGSTMTRECATAVTRVLVVDDEDVIREGLETYLGCFDDFEVVGTASDGAAGVAAVVDLQPDIVLMDIRMPGMDGIAALRAIRALRRPPDVIMLSGYCDGTRAAEVRAAGAQALIDKAAPPGELVATIRARA